MSEKGELPGEKEPGVIAARKRLKELFTGQTMDAFIEEAKVKKLTEFQNGCKLKFTPQLQQALKEQDECRMKFPNGCPRGLERGIMAEGGAEFVGAGISRSAYSFDGCIVKVPHTNDGLIDNKTEAETYKALPDAVKDHFAPVEDVDPDGRWVIMPFVERATKRGRDILAEALRQDIEKKGVRCTDIRGENVGRLEGRPVVFDYGFGVKCEIRKPE